MLSRFAKRFFEDSVEKRILFHRKRIGSGGAKAIELSSHQRV